MTSVGQCFACDANCIREQSDLESTGHSQHSNKPILVCRRHCSCCAHCVITIADGQTKSFDYDTSALSNLLGLFLLVQSACWPILRYHVNIAVNWVYAWRAVHTWHVYDIVESLGAVIIARLPIPRSISRYRLIDMNPIMYARKNNNAQTPCRFRPKTSRWRQRQEVHTQNTTVSVSVRFTVTIC